MEDEIKEQTNQQLSSLSSSVSQIKQASLMIQGHLVDEEGLRREIETGMEKNKSVMH